MFTIDNKNRSRTDRRRHLWLPAGFLCGLMIFAVGCGANIAPPAIGEGTPQPTAGRVQTIVTRLVEQITFVTSTPDPLATSVRVEPFAVLDLSLTGGLPDLDPGLATRQSQLDLSQNLFAGLTNFNPETNKSSRNWHLPGQSAPTAARGPSTCETTSIGFGPEAPAPAARIYGRQARFVRLRPKTWSMPSSAIAAAR